MKKKIIFFVICAILLMILLCILIFNREKKINNIVTDSREVTEVVENITIQGVVELNHNGCIYIFNGQHFGEYGFEMKEYTRAYIDDKEQECIDYYTSQKYNTNYIQEGDILICTGNLIKYTMGDDEFDTKNNSIIVLKSTDYNVIKEEILNNEKPVTITVGDYYNTTGEIYIKYDISDKEYNLPFALKFIIRNDTEIIGDIEKGKRVEVQYKSLSVPLDELELKSVKIIED